MSLEAIEKVTQVEAENKARKAAAEAEAQRIVADAEREGLALLQKARTDAAESGKELLRQGRPRPGSVPLRLTVPRRRRLPPCGRRPDNTWRRPRSLLSEGL